MITKVLTNDGFVLNLKFVDVCRGCPQFVFHQSWQDFFSKRNMKHSSENEMIFYFSYVLCKGDVEPSYVHIFCEIFFIQKHDPKQTKQSQASSILCFSLIPSLNFFFLDIFSTNYFIFSCAGFHPTLSSSFCKKRRDLHYTKKKDWIFQIFTFKG